MYIKFVAYIEQSWCTISNVVVKHNTQLITSKSGEFWEFLKAFGQTYFAIAIDPNICDLIFEMYVQH